MRTYEAVVVFDPGMEVEQIENELRKLHEMLSSAGSVRKWERWGKRRLAFEIKGRQYGYYVLVVFDVEPAAISEIDRNLRINASIIRHLVSVLEPGRAPEFDAESVRTLGAAPESTVTPPTDVSEAGTNEPTETGDSTDADAIVEPKDIAS